MLRGVLVVITDVLEQPTDPIFKGHDRTDRLFWNICDYTPMARSTPGKQTPHLYSHESLKSR